MSYLKTVRYKCGHERTSVLMSKLLAEGTQYRDLKCRPCRVKEDEPAEQLYEESLSDPLADHDRYDEESGPNDTFDDGWKGSTPVNKF